MAVEDGLGFAGRARGPQEEGDTGLVYRRLAAQLMDTVVGDEQGWRELDEQVIDRGVRQTGVEGHEHSPGEPDGAHREHDLSSSFELHCDTGSFGGGRGDRVGKGPHLGAGLTGAPGAAEVVQERLIVVEGMIEEQVGEVHQKSSGRLTRDRRPRRARATPVHACQRRQRGPRFDRGVPTCSRGDAHPPCMHR